MCACEAAAAAEAEAEAEALVVVVAQKREDGWRGEGAGMLQGLVRSARRYCYKCVAWKGAVGSRASVRKQTSDCTSCGQRGCAASAIFVCLLAVVGKHTSIHQ